MIKVVKEVFDNSNDVKGKLIKVSSEEFFIMADNFHDAVMIIDDDAYKEAQKVKTKCSPISTLPYVDMRNTSTIESEDIKKQKYLYQLLNTSPNYMDKSIEINNVYEFTWNKDGVENKKQYLFRYKFYSY